MWDRPIRKQGHAQDSGPGEPGLDTTVCLRLKALHEGGIYHFLHVLILLLSLLVLLIGPVSGQLQVVFQIKGEPAGLVPAHRKNDKYKTLHVVG